MRPWSTMFGLSLMLTLGTTLILTIASIALVMLSPAPFDFPMSTFEVARALKGEKIIRDGSSMPVKTERHPSTLLWPEPVNDPFETLVRAAALRQLGVPEQDFAFTLIRSDDWFSSSVNMAQRKYQRQVLESAKLYGQTQNSSLLIFSAFRAGLRQSDGSWLVVSMDEPGPRWQRGVATWIALMLLLIVPIAWMLSRQLARPIREFSAAAERIGHGNFEHVNMSGPVEIRLAATALNEMQERLQKLIKERTTMIAAIAHDLRTPLARLSFLLADTPATIKDRAHAQLSELDQMIAGTLDFVQQETVQLKYERIDLRALLESVLDDHADLGQDVLLAPGEALMVEADPKVLRRAFANLIDNALKYGQQAHVTVRREVTDAVVMIQDRGPGISEADRSHVFEPFFRGEPSRNRSTGGAGLGLAIVQSALRAHGAEIELVNAQAGGLLVQVRLPLGSV